MLLNNYEPKFPYLIRDNNNLKMPIFGGEDSMKYRVFFFTLLISLFKMLKPIFYYICFFITEQSVVVVFFKDLVYLLERQREKESGEGRGQGERI